MIEAIAMWLARKYTINSFEKTFLAIGEEFNSFIDEVLKCMALYDRKK